MNSQRQVMRQMIVYLSTLSLGIITFYITSIRQVCLERERERKREGERERERERERACVCVCLCACCVLVFGVFAKIFPYAKSGYF